MSKRISRSRCIRQKRGSISLTVMLAILAIAMFALSLNTSDPNEFIGVGVGCAIAAAVMYPYRSQSNNFFVNENGIVMSRSGKELPWKQLVDCRVNRNRVDPASAGYGQLKARFGSEVVPLNFARSHERLGFYQNAWHKIISNHVPNIDTTLAKVFAEDAQEYPSDSVFATGPIGRVSWAKPSVRGYLSILILIVGIVGGAAASSKPPFFIGIAMVLIIVLLAMGLLTWLGRFRKERSKTGKAGLVISPSRFVLQSNTLIGEMTWSELKGVELKPSGRLPSTLRLKLDGVDINLIDEYQLPLWYLYQKIELFRSKYGTSSRIVKPTVSSPQVTQPEKDDNPYSPPALDSVTYSKTSS
jgi:hypothetical protein